MAELILNQVSKVFEQNHVVDQISLNIPQGSFVALLGPSGCGKTTTLRMLAGFETLSEGELRLGHQTLATAKTQLPPEDRNMGMVFQSYALWPHMTVAENVGYPLKHRRIPSGTYQKKIKDALETVEMMPYAQRYPQDLSGGQRQRVALARCLVTDPDVVLLDEPLANLDRHLRASMEESFRAFHQRTGATMIYVTHDQAEAMSLANQIAVMEKGRLVQWSSPEALYHQPKTQWVAEFIGQGSILMGQKVPENQTLMGEGVNALFHPTNERAQSAFLVRPQHVQIELINASLPQSAALTARVTSQVYRGERYEIHLEMPNQQRLQAFHSVAVPIGATVSLNLTQAWSLAA
ncbi:ABC transporter ATP-binding protein [Nitrincola tibetensis]|uniref:ABC transporter ATP-binding protein n=1 Tax=Nitrincola tibetensis TaxID=2219697 RepID=A0A364NM21_9GAMM|nr:ABC transporter ATP-binding protein [Nitrincola tibetensis]RAU18146.1 ABC transporter ATP-binding protein [Nitrincola tibetensis]